ncbi:DUF1800 family protein [Massilia sp. UMI-21]|nr:DUF1800 family protein [Massilia sp. UMI-21]
MQIPSFRSRRALLASLVLSTLPVVSVAGLPQAQAGSPMDEGLALHLLNRLGYGPRPGELARVRALGAAAYVDGQLAPPPLPPRLAARLRELEHPAAAAGEARLLRAIASPRQLEEVLANFWLGWFAAGLDGTAAEVANVANVANGANGANLGPAALRPHVLGRFAALRQSMHGQGRPGRSEDEALRALLRQFVRAPSAGLHRSLARVWKSTGGDQRLVLRALFGSREFVAPAQWNSKHKDGFRFVVSALRASGVAVENVAPLAQWLRGPLSPAAAADFVERLAAGRLALAMAPPRAERQASSAPPLRARLPGEAAQGSVAQPGPVLMEAPTPSAAAMAAAARSVPADPGRLRVLLLSEDFLRY